MITHNKFLIKDYFQLEAQEQKIWLAKIGESDWRAGNYLFKILSEGIFHQQYGKKSGLQTTLYFH